ncbi:hypothetical protein T10_2710, partial [Trichinella papuae]
LLCFSVTRRRGGGLDLAFHVLINVAWLRYQ